MEEAKTNGCCPAALCPRSLVALCVPVCCCRRHGQRRQNARPSYPFSFEPPFPRALPCPMWCSLNKAVRFGHVRTDSGNLLRLFEFFFVLVRQVAQRHDGRRNTRERERGNNCSLWPVSDLSSHPERLLLSIRTDSLKKTVRDTAVPEYNCPQPVGYGLVPSSVAFVYRCWYRCCFLTNAC